MFWSLTFTAVLIQIQIVGLASPGAPPAAGQKMRPD